MAKDRLPYTAENLFVVAKSCLMAALHLNGGTTAPSPIIFASPITILLGHSVETSLKSVILGSRGDADELFAIGHDLRKALAAARECGLHLELPVSSLINELRDIHFRHLLRYVPDVTYIKTPKMPDALVQATALVGQVETLLTARGQLEPMDQLAAKIGKPQP